MPYGQLATAAKFSPSPRCLSDAMQLAPDVMQAAGNGQARRHPDTPSPRHPITLLACILLQNGQPTDELAVAEAVVRLVHDTRCTNCLVWAKSDVVVARVLELSPGGLTGPGVWVVTCVTGDVVTASPAHVGAVSLLPDGCAVTGAGLCSRGRGMC